METQISVVVPVGPDPVYRKWLPECLDSIFEQTYPASQVILVDDMAHLNYEEYDGCDLIKNHTLLGPGLCWNAGVFYSESNCAFLMGSDDTLMPTCLEECVKAYEDIGDERGYYNVTIEDSDGDVHTITNNAAMVTRELWKHTGGFPITGTIGAPDSILISIMIAHLSKHFHQVAEGTPLYFNRIHDRQVTKLQSGFFHAELFGIRDKETARWEPAMWTPD